MTRLPLFGPVFCPYPFPTLPALSSIASQPCCLFVLAVVVVVVVIEVSEEAMVVVTVVVDVVVVVVVPRCRAKDIYKIIFYLTLYSSLA